MASQLCIFDIPQLPDVTRRKHGGERHSEMANERVNDFKASVAERIRLFVAGCGERGGTLKEAVRVMMHPTAVPPRTYYPNEISGRFSELDDAQKIFDSGRDREGCKVWVGRREWVNGSAER